ncbi:MAG TPA: hypothetical protein DCM05_14385 [Elusimicrobia bacterium]|nr:hypothetical protein [Elusimicrobiota bacterium]
MRAHLKRAHRWIVGYAVCFSPCSLLFVYWITRNGGTMPEGGLYGVMNNLGFAWVLSLAYCVAALLFYKEFRESLLSRLAGFREQDERERLVTAHAARNTFLLTLALQTVLLILSLTTVSLVRNPDGHGMLSIGMGFSSSNLDVWAREAPARQEGPGLYFGGHLLPPNTAPIFLLTILIQLAAFRLSSRRGYEGLGA